MCDMSDSDSEACHITWHIHTTKIQEEYDWNAY